MMRHKDEEDLAKFVGAVSLLVLMDFSLFCGASFEFLIFFSANCGLEKHNKHGGSD